MKYILNAIKFVLMLIVTICIVMLVISKITSSTILNKSYILSKLEETGYYEGIYNKINSNFENYIGQSGLDEKVFENIISEDKVKEDVIKIVENLYDNKNNTIDITEVENNLYNNINTNLGRTLSKTEEKAIDEYVNKISEEYKKTILSTSEYESKIANVIEKVNKILPKVDIVLMIIIIILLLVILIINCKQIFNGIAQIGITLMSSGILFIISNIYINTKIKIQNIIILNDTISKTIKVIATDILNVVVKNGTIFLVCGIITIIIANILNKIKQKDKEDFK